MKKKLIRKEVSEAISLRNYYKGLRITELRLIYRNMVDKDVERATLIRMDQEELVTGIVSKILKPLVS